MGVSVRRAGIVDLGAIAPLFEAYCAFYEQDAAPEEAIAFVRDRLRVGDSVFFLAEVREPRGGNRGVGFVQLYPKWSSTTMRRDWILNDLFVEPGHRRRGVGRALMEEATAFCRRTGAANVSLKTQVGNEAAQALYESLGWVRDEEFHRYDLAL